MSQLTTGEDLMENMVGHSIDIDSEYCESGNYRGRPNGEYGRS